MLMEHYFAAAEIASLLDPSGAVERIHVTALYKLHQLFELERTHENSTGRTE